MFLWLFCPETKGLTLEEMDEIFGSAGMAAGEQERFVDIEKRIGLDAYNYGSSDHARMSSSDKEYTEKV